jgi:hypothetical protein
MHLPKLAAAGLILFMSASARAQETLDNVQPQIYPAPVFEGRRDNFRDNQSGDPEPFRCTYADDRTCTPQRDTSDRGDPRDNPEPFRCTYSAGPECGGADSGAQ